MIDFTCTQCGNQFRVEEKLAGRHGWCKVCKSFVVVPKRGDDGVQIILNDTERESLLARLLRDASSAYDKEHLRHHLLIKRYKDLRKRQGGEDDSAEILETGARLQESQTQVERLTGELHGLAEERGSLAARADRVEGEARELEHAVEDARARQTDLETRLAEAEAAAARASELDKELATVKQRLHESSTQLEQLRDELAGGDATDLETRVADLHLECERLRETLHEAEGAAERAQDAEAAANRRASQLEEDLSAKAARYESQEERLDRLHAVEAELESARSKSKADDSRIERLMQELAETAQNLGKARAESEHAGHENERLTKTLAENAEAGGQLGERLRDAERRLEEALHQSVSKAGPDTTLSLLETELNMAKSRLAEAEEQIERLTRQLGDKARELGVTEARLAQATKELEALRQAPAAGPSTGAFRAESASLDDVDTFVPELIDDPVESDEMMDTLLRFLDQRE
jgi:chromosome segregation ATPase